MTRDEIRLVIFVLLAIALGTTVKWWKQRGPQQTPAGHVEPRKSGWADPPYVFKSKAAMESAGTTLGKRPAEPLSVEPAAKSR